MDSPGAYEAGFIEYESAVGAGAVTAMCSTVCVEPAAFEPVTVYSVEEETSSGVPLRTPVARLRPSPGGSAGVTVYRVMVPPALDGASGTMGTPTTKVPVSRS